MLVIYEAAGAEAETASYLIRSLLSEGHVRYLTTEKTPTGLASRMIEREGPTGLVTTTTRTRLHGENETRLLSISVTDTAEQTKAVMLALASESAQRVPFQQWHAFQEWLASGPADVTIPYAVALAKLTEPLAVRLRRDFAAVLELIEHTRCCTRHAGSARRMAASSRRSRTTARYASCWQRCSPLALRRVCRLASERPSKLCAR